MTTPTTPPTIRTNVQNGDTIHFGANGMFILIADAVAPDGVNVNSLAMACSWGLTVEGFPSGSGSIQAGAYLFAGFNSGEQNVVVTVNDNDGGTTVKTINFAVVA